MSGEQAFCSKCGSPVAPGSAFCNKCGAAIGVQAQPQQAEMWQRRHEKHEKAEKREKGEKDEKHERGRGGGIAGPITGGLVLIWLGVSFYFAVSGRLAWENWWQLFLMGLGAIIIFQGFVMYAEGRRGFTGPFIGGAVVFLVGAVFYLGFEFGNLWPLLLVALGVVVLLSAAFGRRRAPRP